MPFTPAHVAAVLPLVGRTPYLPSAALVAGAMTPDYPWFLTGGRTAGLSHSAVGVLTVDLAVGVLAVLAWRRLAHEPVRDLLPPVLGHRLPEAAPTPARDVPWVALGVLVGAATHVVWDSFTHSGRWGVDLVPWLAATHGALPGYKWAQYLGGALGLLAVTGWGLRRLVRAVPAAPRCSAGTGVRLLAAGLVAAGLVVGVVVGVTRALLPTVESALFGAVTRGVLGAGLGALAGVALWWVASRPREPADVIR